jgi:hypothetical protein
MKRRLPSNWQTWGWPVILAILTLAGLFMALLGEGDLSRTASWLALGTPVAVIAWKLYASRP